MSNKGYIIQQKWSPTRRKMTKQFTIHSDNPGHPKRLVHTSNSYESGVRWIRKQSKR